MSWDARSIVGHADGHAFVFRQEARPDRDVPSVRHRLNRILKEVEKDPLKFFNVSPDGWEGFLRFKRERDLSGEGFRSNHVPNSSDHFVDMDELVVEPV